jgi:peptide/nickel transport system permease protein
MATKNASFRLPSIDVLGRFAVQKVPRAVILAGVVLGLLAVIAVGADLLRPLDTRTLDLAAVLSPPSLAHPMGTDELGRDVLARVFHGLRVSFAISIAAAAVSLGIGATYGLVSAAFGSRVDSTLMRFLDFFASQNHLVFGIFLVVLFRPALGPIGAVLLSVGVTHWTSMARIVRGELMSLRERPFVLAAVNGGAGYRRLFRRHFLPHLLPAIGLGFVLLLPHAIFHESALSFLGLGLPPHQASLGNILASGRQSLFIGGWWTTVFPGLLIFLFTLSVGTLGEYWRDRQNPRWRSELEL